LFFKEISFGISLNRHVVGVCCTPCIVLGVVYHAPSVSAIGEGKTKDAFFLPQVSLTSILQESTSKPYHVALYPQPEGRTIAMDTLPPFSYNRCSVKRQSCDGIRVALCRRASRMTNRLVEYMANEEKSDTATVRASLRPVLIASRSTLVEQSTFVRHLLVGLVDESISTTLICPPGCDVDSIVPAPVTVLVHPSVDLPLMEHFGISHVATQLAKSKPTVLHSLSEGKASLVADLAHRLDLPYVQTVNSLVRHCRQITISPQRCRAVIVPAGTIGAAVARACAQFADRVRQINVGSFIEEDTVCFPDPSRLASIVVAHPLHRVSDFKSFLRAVKTLLSDGYRFMVVLMGSGRAEHRLRRLLTVMDLAQTVTIVPVLNPWRSVLAAGDIFVQPQPLQAFSVFLLEAMSLGTAVAACMGGIDDLIVPDQTAVVFEPQSEQSIRQVLARLLDERDFARRIARTAQEHLRASYSVSQMIEATLRTYAEAQQQNSG
jgi:glycosyltransferase involved in cell wall biosynthesis